MRDSLTGRVALGYMFLQCDIASQAEYLAPYFPFKFVCISPSFLKTKSESHPVVGIKEWKTVLAGLTGRLPSELLRFVLILIISLSVSVRQTVTECNNCQCL